LAADFADDADFSLVVIDFEAEVRNLLNVAGDRFLVTLGMTSAMF
jgi:hypothetical protein